MQAITDKQKQLLTAWYVNKKRRNKNIIIPEEYKQKIIYEFMQKFYENS